jgi:hypothetical protein
MSEAGDTDHRCPHAASERASGAVHGVHQDRLIKKLRRKKIASYEGANEYLQK